jgi:hypothetical protein
MKFWWGVAWRTGIVWLLLADSLKEFQSSHPYLCALSLVLLAFNVLALVLYLDDDIAQS